MISACVVGPTKHVALHLIGGVRDPSFSAPASPDRQRGCKSGPRMPGLWVQDEADYDPNPNPMYKSFLASSAGVDCTSVGLLGEPTASGISVPLHIPQNRSTSLEVIVVAGSPAELEAKSQVGNDLARSAFLVKIISST